MCNATIERENAGEAAGVDLEGAVNVGEAIACAGEACDCLRSCAAYLGRVRGFSAEATAVLEAIKSASSAGRAIAKRRDDLAAVG